MIERVTSILGGVGAMQQPKLRLSISNVSEFYDKRQNYLVNNSSTAMHYPLASVSQTTIIKCYTTTILH